MTERPETPRGEANGELRPELSRSVWDRMLTNLSGISLSFGKDRFAAFVFIGALTLVTTIFFPNPLVLLFPSLFVLTLVVAKHFALLDNPADKTDQRGGFAPTDLAR